MAPDLEDRVPREILEALIEEGTEAFRKVMEKLLNLAMGLERSEFLGADPYERTSRRRGHANGYKDKKIATRVGELRLKIPQVRGLSFYPRSLEKGCRSEKALKLAVAEMYVMGVSTRKVSEITEQLCGSEISASQVSRVASLLDEELEKFRSRPLSGAYPFVYLDAHYEKVRVDGRVQDLAILKAVGVHASGHREVLGLSARLSEAEIHWRAFLEDLAGRGLKGIEMLISDDHAGLKAARRAVLSCPALAALPVSSEPECSAFRPSARRAGRNWPSDAGHLQQSHAGGRRSHAQTQNQGVHRNQPGAGPVDGR